MMRIHSPGDMRALRLLTGISAEQAGQLFGCTAQSVVDNERSTEVVTEWRDALLSLQDEQIKAAQECFMILRKTEKQDKEVLYGGGAVIFTNDEDFREVLPVLAQRLHFANVHTLVMMRVKFLVDKPLALIVYRHADYRQWCAENGQEPDAGASLSIWVAARARETTMRSDRKPGARLS